MSTDKRVGIGYDAHSFAEGRRLVLGGVELEGDGLAGHSDADVVTHAVIDSLLGAAGLGDIGERFPDTDEQYRDADSIELLKEVLFAISQEGGWRVVNVDLTVIAERPRLNDVKPEIKRSLAAALGVFENHVNLKATTNEGMGFIGRGEGIAAIAIAQLER